MGVSQMDFYPQEEPNLKFPVIFFRLKKGTAIILTVVSVDFSTLSGTNLQILTPKRYDEHLRHFYMVVLPPRDLDQ